MIVDMHVHTNVASFCSRLSPDDLIKRAGQLALDAVCITEHSTQRGVAETAALAAESGLKVFTGMEVYTEMGDMLVFGFPGPMRHHVTAFATLRAMVEAAGGVIIPAHPCRGMKDLHEWYGPEAVARMMEGVVAVETHNGCMREEANRMASRLSEAYGLPGTGGSDAHGVDHLGRCVTEFERDIIDDADLIAALREGCFQARYLRGTH